MGEVTTITVPAERVEPLRRRAAILELKQSMAADLAREMYRLFEDGLEPSSRSASEQQIEEAAA